MNHSLSDTQVKYFNQHYDKGWDLMQSVVILEGKNITKPNIWQRWKGRRAVSHFKKCLELVPTHWQTHWGLGKAYQGLGEHAAALASFAEAYRLHPENPDVAREASIAAMDAGQPDLAVEYSAVALALCPDDAGLMCNHAINLLVAGKDPEATALITKSMSLAPNDQINQHAFQLIQAVVSGQKKRPTWQSIN
jgi:Flp pilus assembly protein TadD